MVSVAEKVIMRLERCHACESENVELCRIRANGRLRPHAFFVRCEDCEVKTGFYSTPAKAAHDWNGDDEE